MAKSGKLSAAEQYYIETNPHGKTVHELAAELDRSPKTVAKYYETKAVIEVTPEQKAEIANPESPMFKLMGRHIRGDKHVATVMTQAASELADATRPARLTEKGKLKDAIHKPKG